MNSNRNSKEVEKLKKELEKIRNNMIFRNESSNDKESRNKSKLSIAFENLEKNLKVLC